MGIRMDKQRDQKATYKTGGRLKRHTRLKLEQSGGVNESPTSNTGSLKAAERKKGRRLVLLLRKCHKQVGTSGLVNKAKPFAYVVFFLELFLLELNCCFNTKSWSVTFLSCLLYTSRCV